MYLSSVFNKSRFAVLACISAASLGNVPCDYLNSRLKTINKQRKSGRKLSFSPLPVNKKMGSISSLLDSLHNNTLGGRKEGGRKGEETVLKEELFFQTV